MTRKAVETLLILVENGGQVLTKDEIISAVWPDRVVDEANLTQNVAVIRRTLGVERGSPGYIETYAGRGYRLLGPIDAVEQAAPAGLSVVPMPRRHHWAVAAALMAVALGLFAIFRRSAPEPQSAYRIIPVTRTPGREFQPAVSPDGTRVAFVWASEDAKTNGVWMQAFDETSPHPVSQRKGHYSSPAWSPDGHSLAYLRTERSATEVLISDVDKSEERLVTRLTPPDYGIPTRMLDWSPTGEYLAVSHAASPDRVASLFLISVARGESRKLTEPEDTIAGDLGPRFSPDGRTITFIRFIARLHQELFSIPVSGGAPRQLTSDQKQVSSHDWMPDGKTIVMASDRGGEFRLWKIRPGAADPSKTAAPLAIYSDSPIQLSLARKAPTLVYATLQQDRNIWRLDLASGRWTRVIASSGQDASPQYSPAGDRICFRSDRGGDDQLWVSKADGSDPVEVTHGSIGPSVGRWSPDGRTIVFNSSLTSEIFLATLGADGKWTTRSAGASGIHPVFSPDGRWIYAGTRSGVSIIRLPAAGGSATEVARTRAISLDVSPDGRFIYFLREPNENRLWRVSTDTGALSMVLEGLVPGCTSCWALAPTGVYYLGSNRESFDSQTLYFHDLATGRERAVAEYPEPLWPMGSGPFSLSPGHRNLLCVRVDPSNSDIMRVQPFQ